MLRSVKPVILTLTLMGSMASSFAFSLLGPLEPPWQVQRISYGHVPPVFVDIGGPKNLGEEYRWNIRTISYAFDPSFVNYFGTRGMEEVRKAIAVFNGLPPFSKMSADLSEFPLDSRRFNYEASSLFLVDMKSLTMAIMLEQLGLASPERYVWTLYARLPQVAPLVIYNVVMRNFDPVTTEPSKYVNGVLYTYGIYEIPSPPYDWADAVELPVDPLAPVFTSVVSAADGLWGASLVVGGFYTGLTRDDVGGLRYLYRTSNYNVEAPLAGTILTGGGPGTPVNPANTNTVNTALRPGADKLTFVEARFDSLLGGYIGLTNNYVDYYVTNGVMVKQFTQRILTTAPDILFSAADLGAGLIARTDTTGWVNNEALNHSPAGAVLDGPGVIAPTVVFVYGKRGPFLINDNSSSDFLFESGATFSSVWGAFDGTTNRPIVFPNGASIDALEQQVMHP